MDHSLEEPQPRIVRMLEDAGEFFRREVNLYVGTIVLVIVKIKRSVSDGVLRVVNLSLLSLKDLAVARLQPVSGVCG